MKASKTEILTHFLLRIEMYIGKYDQYGIESFLTGFELGSNNEFHLTRKISAELDNVYNIKRRALGWTFQVEEYCKRNNIDWISGFTRLSFRVIYDYLTDDQKHKTNQLIRDNIASKLTRLDRDFNIIWISKWKGICDLNQKWFCEIWTQQQLEFIIKFNQEIQKNIDLNKIKTSDSLIHISRELLNEIKKTQVNIS